jgi:hypothetical protein
MRDNGRRMTLGKGNGRSKLQEIETWPTSMQVNLSILPDGKIA